MIPKGRVSARGPRLTRRRRPRSALLYGLCGGVGSCDPPSDYVEPGRIFLAVEFYDGARTDRDGWSVGLSEPFDDPDAPPPPYAQIDAYTAVLVPGRSDAIQVDFTTDRPVRAQAYAEKFTAALDARRATHRSRQAPTCSAKRTPS